MSSRSSHLPSPARGRGTRLRRVKVRAPDRVGPALPGSGAEPAPIRSTGAASHRLPRAVAGGRPSAPAVHAPEPPPSSERTADHLTLNPGYSRGRAGGRGANMRRDFDAIVLGLGGIGSGALYWLSRRLGDRVLGIEQFATGHDRGGSQDHSRIIRYSYHRPCYVRLAARAYRPGRRSKRRPASGSSTGSAGSTSSRRTGRSPPPTTPAASTNAASRRSGSTPPRFAAAGRRAPSRTACGASSRPTAGWWRRRGPTPRTSRRPARRGAVARRGSRGHRPALQPAARSKWRPAARPTGPAAW